MLIAGVIDGLIYGEITPSTDQGVFTQYDKSMIVLKLAGAQARKRAREGRKPFGYYEGEQIAVERMRALKNEGLGFDRIACQLNSEGIPTRTGRPWHGFVVNRILGG
jgi:hypothetical protein